MANGTPFKILALVVAVIGAVLLGTVAHDLIGLSRGMIRQDALAGATLIGIVCVAESLFRRNE